MKKRYGKVFIGILILLAILASGVAGYAVGSRRTLTPEQTFYASVENIGDNSLTVSGLDINDVNSRGKFQLTLTGHTLIEWNNTPIKLSDLKPGSRISVTYTGEVDESDPAQIKKVTKIKLLEDELDHAPRLVFRDAQVTTHISYPGYGGSYMADLSYEDICALWNIKSLPGLSSIEQSTPWEGHVEFYEDGSIAVIELLAYSNAIERDNGIYLCRLSIRPNELPLQYARYNDETPTCTLWETPVVALNAGTNYQSSENMALAAYDHLYLRFMTDGAESVGVEGDFYAPSGKLEQTKSMMNTITGYFLDLDNSFTLDAISYKVPDPWKSNTEFTSYIPEAFKDYALQTSRFETESDGSESLALYYSEEETGGGSNMRWTIKKPYSHIQPVNISEPKSYDLRQNDAVDSSDIYSLGLAGKLSGEAIEILSNPVFAVEDLTDEIMQGRIFEHYENYFLQPYLQFSVLYPDNTVIEFSGHWDPKTLCQLFTALPQEGEQEN